MFYVYKYRAVCTIVLYIHNGIHISRFMNLGISILFKKPKREKPGIFSFLNPLGTVVYGTALESQGDFA